MNKRKPPNLKALRGRRLVLRALISLDARMKTLEKRERVVTGFASVEGVEDWPNEDTEIEGFLG